MSAIRMGSPARREAKSRMACSAYSPFTELCMGLAGRNHLYLTRDCIHGMTETQSEPGAMPKVCVGGCRYGLHVRVENRLRYRHWDDRRATPEPVRNWPRIVHGHERGER